MTFWLMLFFTRAEAAPPSRYDNLLESLRQKKQLKKTAAKKSGCIVAKLAVLGKEKEGKRRKNFLQMSMPTSLIAL